MNYRKKLFYPCSGSDWETIFNIYKNEVDDFIFVDLLYTSNRVKPFIDKLSKISDLKIETEGTLDSNIEIINTGYLYSFIDKLPNGKTIEIMKEGKNQYRNIEPGFVKISFKYNNSEKTIVFRRGFAQYALNEIENDSLDYFCHRKDSPGESGSNIYFFGNRPKNHEPLSNLFDKLILKMKNESFFISDGSLVSIKKMYKFYKKLKHTQVIFPMHYNRFKFKNVEMTAIDIIGGSVRKSVLWSVKKY